MSWEGQEHSFRSINHHCLNWNPFQRAGCSSTWCSCSQMVSNVAPREMQPFPCSFWRQWARWSPHGAPLELHGPCQCSSSSLSLEVAQIIQLQETAIVALDCDGEFYLFLSSTWQQLGRTAHLCGWLFLSVSVFTWEAALARKGNCGALLFLIYPRPIYRPLHGHHSHGSLHALYWIIRCLYPRVALPKWF